MCLDPGGRGQKRGQRRGCSAIRGGDGIGQAVLGAGAHGDDEDGREPVKVPGSATTCPVAVIGGELGAQLPGTHGAAVELEKEAVVATTKAQETVAIGTEPPAGTRQGVAPFDELATPWIDASGGGQASKDSVCPQGVPEVREESCSRTDGRGVAATCQTVLANRRRQRQTKLCGEHAQTEPGELQHAAGSPAGALFHGSRLQEPPLSQPAYPSAHPGNGPTEQSRQGSGAHEGVAANEVEDQTISWP